MVSYTTWHSHSHHKLLAPKGDTASIHLTIAARKQKQRAHPQESSLDKPSDASSSCSTGPRTPEFKLEGNGLAEGAYRKGEILPEGELLTQEFFLGPGDNADNALHIMFDAHIAIDSQDEERSGGKLLTDDFYLGSGDDTGAALDTINTHMVVNPQDEELELQDIVDTHIDINLPDEEPESPRPPQETDTQDIAIDPPAEDEAAPQEGSYKFYFDVPEPPPPPCDVFSSDGPSAFWQIFLLLVAYLNLRFHLPHRACNLILSVLRTVFLHLGLLSKTDQTALTLRTVFNSLGLQDPFIVLPMCLTCRRIFPMDSPLDLCCDNCNLALFKSKACLQEMFTGSEEKDEEQTNIPHLRFPFHSLSMQLPEFLNREGIEDALDSWRAIEHTQGEMRDIMDGRVWKTLKAADSSLFFDNSLDRSNPDELHIGVTLHFDGFGGERGRSAPSHSSGVLSHCVANLPAHLKYQPGNLMLTGITPGPRELSADELQFVLEADIDDKIRLYKEGVVVQTPRYPNGKYLFNLSNTFTLN
ncbi:hypothetical protein EW145_g4181 [Phellinidium pouzarii]|uniref:Uncharacterized protein n=1 Tax=Phellinidium pouzarii TaxID=167371 RepID=A0A4S4L4N2_9AGAM|nr:hypothetical protein EW145_g4181 [Phellinidium pouzarii]